MYNINYKNIQTNINWSLENSISLIDKYNGTLLFSSPSTKKTNKIVIGLNPVFEINSKENSLNQIDNIIELNKHIDFPFLFGYISYDAKNIFEEKNLYKNYKENVFHDFNFVMYQYIIILNENWKTINEYELNNKKTNNNSITEFRKDIEYEKSSFKVSDPISKPTKDEFISGVDKIKEYIKQGDVYQVNLTRKVTCNFSGSKIAAAISLLKSNTIEFGVFFKHENNYIISTSPERFFTYNKNKILVSPIKGTVKRTQNDTKVKQELLKDTKNIRELAMITDLLRNDISTVCEPGSVTVDAFPKIKTLQNLFHLVSDITGKLNTTKFSEIIKALFPGGSITGCPKIRTCQIIEELEKQGRGIYTGTFGYLTGTQEADFNILIRTVVIKDNKLWFNVGGGITLMSDKYEEYQETQLKAENILKALNINNK